MIDLSVLTPTAILLAVAGGAAAGWFLWIVHPGRVVSSGSAARLTLWYIAALGLFFYPGRYVADLVEIPAGAPRLVSGFVLWIVFALGAALATYILARRVAPPGPRA